MSEYEEGHTPSKLSLKVAYREYITEKENPRYIEKGKTPLTVDEIDAEFDRAISLIEDAAKSEGFKIARETMREFGRNVWKQCCEAFVWALDNGPTNRAVQYVAETCPFDKKPEGEDGAQED